MAEPSSSPPLTVVVLAAGEGTRMRSPSLPKVLHGFAGRSLLGHVLAATEPLDAAETLVVVGHRREQVVAHLAEIAPGATPVVQDEQHGTGHATRLALEARPPAAGGTVLLVPGDAPLLTPRTLGALLEQHAASGAAATLLTSELADPTGYGRVLRDGAGHVARIVEQRDATPAELEVREVGTSVYAFAADALGSALGRLSTDNAQGEEYVTDVVEILVADGLPVGALLAPPTETAGVNDRVQLAAAHRAYNARVLEAHMRAGVTVVDPATTWIDAGVTIEADVTIEPGVDLHGTTHVAAGAVIGPQVTLTDTSVGAGARVVRAVANQARIGAGVTIGPYAYLRPGTVLAEGVHVGTYVELKNAEVGAGSKVPHLSYVGDATIGEGTNIGAAVVFVNYDGVHKNHTVVGDHAFVGSDSMLVAPVSIGDGAYTAAGSVITQDVPAGAIGVGRAAQRNVAGWVRRKRAGTPSAAAAERAAEKRPATSADDSGRSSDERGQE